MIYLMRIIIYNPKKVTYCQKKNNSSIPNRYNKNERTNATKISHECKMYKIREYYILKSIEYPCSTPTRNLNRYNIMHLCTLHL